MLTQTKLHYSGHRSSSFTLEVYGDDDGEGLVEEVEVQVLIPNTLRKIRTVLDHVDDFDTPVVERSKLIAVKSKITKQSSTIRKIDDESIADILKIFECSSKHIIIRGGSSNGS